MSDIDVAQDEAGACGSSTDELTVAEQQLLEEVTATVTHPPSTAHLRERQVPSIRSTEQRYPFLILVSQATLILIIDT